MIIPTSILLHFHIDIIRQYMNDVYAYKTLARLKSFFLFATHTWIMAYVKKIIRLQS